MKQTIQLKVAWYFCSISRLLSHSGLFRSSVQSGNYEEGYIILSLFGTAVLIVDLLLTASDHDSNMSDWVDMSVGTPAPGVPVMASTAIKRRRMDEESVGGASEQSEDFQES